MSDAVTSQTLFDGSKKTIIKLTNISDGTGESAVVKVDVSALVNTPTKVKITKIWYATNGMAVQMLWDATANVLAFALGADQVGCLDFTSFGGIVNNAGTGVTGDLLFTTVGHSSGDSYSIILELSK
jgi:hypothetical protein